MLKKMFYLNFLNYSRKWVQGIYYKLIYYIYKKSNNIFSQMLHLIIKS